MSINGIGKEFRIRIAGSNDVTVGNMSKVITKTLGIKEPLKVQTANPWDACILYKDNWFFTEASAVLNPEAKSFLYKKLLSKLQGDATISFTPISPVTPKLNEIV